MSYNLRLRRVAFDNVAVGSAAGRERHTGGAGTTELLAKENPAIGSTGHTTGTLDRMITSTGGVTTGYTNETMVNTN